MSEKALAARRRNALKADAIDVYVQKIVDRAPELTEDHMARLRALLRPVSGGASE